MKNHQDLIESLALAVVACPPGAWGETQQAIQNFREEAGRFVGSRWVCPDPVAVARKAIKRGAARPPRAGEWGL